MKRFYISAIAFTLVLLITSATNRRSSSGAPASHTGGPGEETCASSGCHDDNRINSGTAQLNISFENEVGKIEAGKTYPLKIKITDKDVSRFGFQIVALEKGSGKNAGTFNITDSLRTQLVQNAYKFSDRNYVTYTFSGTDAVSIGTGEWSVNWTAPSTLKKGVTFYVAGVSANDDMSDKGDKVYTTHLTINK